MSRARVQISSRLPRSDPFHVHVTHFMIPDTGPVPRPRRRAKSRVAASLTPASPRPRPLRLRSPAWPGRRPRRPGGRVLPRRRRHPRCGSPKSLARCVGASSAFFGARALPIAPPARPELKRDARGPAISGSLRSPSLESSTRAPALSSSHSVPPVRCPPTGLSFSKKASTGTGLPPGPFGLLGAVEGFAFLAALAGIVVRSPSACVRRPHSSLRGLCTLA